jgi:hypothetical protein
MEQDRLHVRSPYFDSRCHSLSLRERMAWATQWQMPSLTGIIRKASTEFAEFAALPGTGLDIIARTRVVYPRKHASIRSEYV